MADYGHVDDSAREVVRELRAESQRVAIARARKDILAWMSSPRGPIPYPYHRAVGLLETAAERAALNALVPPHKRMPTLAPSYGEIAAREEAREAERMAMGRAAMERATAHDNASRAERSAKKTRDFSVETAVVATAAAESARKAAEHLAGVKEATSEMSGMDISAVEAAAALAAAEATKAAEAAAYTARAAAAAERLAAQTADAAKMGDVAQTGLLSAKAESAEIDAERKLREATAAAAAAGEAVSMASSSRRAIMEELKKTTRVAYDPAKVERYRALLEEFKGEFMKDKATKAKATMIDNAVKAGTMPPPSLFTKKQKERIRAANLANVAGLNAAATGGARRRRTQRRRRQQ